MTADSIGVFAASLAYIAFWIYLFITWVIPIWSVPLVEILNISIWAIMGTILFFTGGVALLMIAIFFMGVVVFD